MCKTEDQHEKKLTAPSVPAPSASTSGAAAATPPPPVVRTVESAIGTGRSRTPVLNRTLQVRQHRMLCLADLSRLYQDLFEILLTRRTQGKPIDRLENQIAWLKAAELEVENWWPEV